jgi:hypothetical protein
MTDTIDATARCLACDTPVHALCRDGAARYLECTPSPDGEFGLVAGRFKELPAGSMVASGCMRFRDHGKHCKASLRPDPSEVPTRPIGPRQRRRLP